MKRLPQNPKGEGSSLSAPDKGTEQLPKIQIKHMFKTTHLRFFKRRGEVDTPLSTWSVAVEVKPRASRSVEGLARDPKGETSAGVSKVNK